MKSKIYTTEVGGKVMSAEFTDLAEQAHGSVILRYGNTTVLTTVVMGSKVRDDIDYTPVKVEYEERFYATGAILDSMVTRREDRPSDDAMIYARAIDRTIRPLFTPTMRQEVHVVITVLALDKEDPCMLAVNAASLALAVSDIPWAGPVAAVRISKHNEEFVINPTNQQRSETHAALDMLVCGRNDTINMIETASEEASEEVVLEALNLAVEEHKKILEFQEKIVAEIGKEKKEIATPDTPQELVAFFEREFTQKLHSAVFCGIAGKDAIQTVQDEWVKTVKEKSLERDSPLTNMNISLAKQFFRGCIDEEIHRGAIEDGQRADGRAFEEIRGLFAKAGGVSDVLHGTGIFYRGGTHVFTALALGKLPSAGTEEDRSNSKTFTHQYNFPPYSTGETGRIGSVNRRAVGHGALAEKALLPMIPSKEKFPYTIHLTSECFASNGSTSMGSVCASTLALMDGGVPLVRPVAGIAIGAMLSTKHEKNSQHKILTDIQGPEDEFGDMDLKVAGTREGITAIQMDTKLEGIPAHILLEAFSAAKDARLKILDVMEREIKTPRSQNKVHNK